MKPSYSFVAIFVFLLVASPLLSQLRWKWQNPKSQGNDLRSVHAISSTVAVAVGDAGTVLKTTNSGTTWDTAFCAGGRSGTLYDVYFPSASRGYAVGAGGVILRNNGGHTWQLLPSPVSSTLFGVSFVNNDTGLVVGDGGVILRTTTGGNSWLQQTSGTVARLFEITFKSTTLAVAVGDSNKILKSTDLGLSWIKKNVSNRGFNTGVAFFNTTNGYVVGKDTCTFNIFAGTKLRLQYTTNGGDTWTTDTTGGCTVLLGFGPPTKSYGIAMPGSTTTYVVGPSGMAWKQTALSSDWTGQASNTTEKLLSVSFATATTGYAVGSCGTIIKTVNGGSTWTSCDVAITHNQFNGVDFYDTRRGFAVGNSGTIARTTNAGDLWTLDSSGTTFPLNGVDMLNSTTAVVVGASGTVLKNSGFVWSPKTSGVNKNLYSVSFGHPDTGWAVGDSGTIIVTNSGGVNWSQQFSNTARHLYGVKFVDVLNGWAVGQNGIVLHTGDGGQFWTQQLSDNSTTLYGVDFVDKLHGTAVGDNGRIIQTSTGGSPWYPRVSGTTQTLRSVSFTSLRLGLAVSSGGLILLTTDGGTTWKPDSCVTDNILYGVSYVNGGGTAVGSCGTIVRADTGYFTTQPPGINYGSVVLLNSRPDTLRLTNTGLTDISISSIASDHPEFSITSFAIMPAAAEPDTGSWVLPPDSFLNLIVTFSPLTAGYKIGHIIINHNSLASPESLVVTGYGLDTSVKASYRFGYPPEEFPTKLCFPTHHKDVVAMVFVAPTDGTLDTLHFKMCNVGALDSTVYVRIFKSTTGRHSGPGHGGYADCTPWGYFPNTNDVDQGIGAFTDVATGAWVSTTGGSPASIPLQGDHLWGGPIGIPKVLTPNAVNSVVMLDFDTLQVQKGDSIFVTIRIKGVHGNDAATEFAAYAYPGGICVDSLTPVWKFYEHNEKSSECPQVPGVQGWRTICDGNQLGGIVFNWWFTMTPATDTPPEILSVSQVDNTLSTDPQTVTANVIDDIAISTVQICPCCDGTQFPCGYMVNSVGNEWQGDVPGQAAGTEVCYQIVATDVNGNTTVSPPSRYTVVDLFTDHYKVDTSAAYLQTDSLTTPIPLSSFFLPAGDYDDKPTQADRGTAGPFDLGGPFVFFGQTVQYAWIGVDGAIALTASPTDTQYVLLPPGTWRESHVGGGGWLMPKNFVAPYWADFEIDTSSGDHVEYGFGPDSVEFLVRWNNLEPHPNSIERQVNGLNKPTAALQRVQMGLRLNRLSGIIDFFYDDTIAHAGKGLVAMASRPDTITRSVFLYNNGSPSELAPKNHSATHFCPVVPESVCTSWNLLSLPVMPCDTPAFKATIFPTSTSPAYWWCPPYCELDPLEVGKGFWLKFDQSFQAVPIAGEMFSSIDIPLKATWNMIGSTSYPVPVASITTTPPGIIASNFFSYNACSNPGYQVATTIKPGWGYWVRANAVGVLHMIAPQQVPKTSHDVTTELSTLSRIILTDKHGYGQTLYLGGENSLNLPLSFYELPPSVPEGVFTASFGSGRIVETYSTDSKKSVDQSYVVELKNATYPVVFAWEPQVEENNEPISISVSDGEGEKFFSETVFDKRGSLTITNSSVKRLVVKVASTLALLPKEFALDQSYPNPFNPTATIRYALPVDARIVLKIYDILGQEVETLIDGVQEAGYKSVRWNANRFASGVYYYNLDATSLVDPNKSFRHVMKMVLVK